MTNIKTATHLYYKPRQSSYNVLYQGTNCKTESGWLRGCTYQDIDTGEVYSRPYEWFKGDNWIIT